MFLTSLKQICNEYLIKFSENQSASKLENRKTSPCSPRAPNLLHVFPSRMVGWHKLCNPGGRGVRFCGSPHPGQIGLKYIRIENKRQPFVRRGAGWSTTHGLLLYKGTGELVAVIRRQPTCGKVTFVFFIFFTPVGCASNDDITAFFSSSASVNYGAR